MMSVHAFTGPALALVRRILTQGEVARVSQAASDRPLPDSQEIPRSSLGRARKLFRDPTSSLAEKARRSLLRGSPEVELRSGFLADAPKQAHCSQGE
jgi:hypothetical protein